MTAEEFFRRVARPTAEEFLSNPTCRRRGFLAAITLFHVFDYWKQNQKSRGLKEIYARCPEFKIIRSVANAAKHCVLTNESHVLKTSDQIKATSHPGLFEAPFGTAMFAEASEVVVTLDDGTTKHLKPLVQSVLSMWASYYPSATLPSKG